MKSRLIEERKRLGLSQEKMAELGGAGKRTYCDYESGVSEPKASFLTAIAAAGADVQYILTGIRTTPAITELNPREVALLDNYRHIEDENDKRIIERNAFLVAKAYAYEATEQKAVNYR
jgi:transcriptional regulator with XRE-family HTH domain